MAQLLDVEKLILQLPPHVSPCDYTVQLSGFSNHLLLGDQLALTYLPTWAAVLARAESS